MRKFVKIILLIMLIGITIDCFPDQRCTLLGNQFQIDNWKGGVPRCGVLYRYKKGSNFSVLEQKNKNDFKAEIFHPKENPQPSLIVNFIGYGKYLPAESDYKLVLDNKIEYRIHGLVTTYEGEDHPCMLLEGKANQCDLSGEEVFSFSSKCGKPVK